MTSETRPKLLGCGPYLPVADLGKVATYYEYA